MIGAAMTFYGVASAQSALLKGSLPILSDVYFFV
jgi:hypothetical protein